MAVTFSQGRIGWGGRGVCSVGRSGFLLSNLPRRQSHPLG
jgi:hypothetical protein